MKNKNRIGLIIASLLLLASLDGCQQKAPPQGVVLTQAQFVDLVASNRIAKGVILIDPQSFLHEVRGRYYQSDTNGQPVLVNGKRVEVDFTARVRLIPELQRKLLASGVFQTAQSSAVGRGTSRKSQSIPAGIEPKAWIQITDSFGFVITKYTPPPGIQNPAAGKETNVTAPWPPTATGFFMARHDKTWCRLQTEVPPLEFLPAE